VADDQPRSDLHTGCDIDSGQKEIQTGYERAEQGNAVPLENMRQAVQHHRLKAVVEEHGFDQVPGGVSAVESQPLAIVAQVAEHPVCRPRSCVEKLIGG